MSKTGPGLLLFAFLMVNAPALAEVIQRSIPVAKTNSAIKQMRGPHEAYWSTTPSKNVLLVTFGGTQSRPTDLKAFAETAADLGFDVLTLDYDNSVISTTCKDSKDLTCFDHFREEIATGKDVSSLVSVDPANSLEARLLNALKFLAVNDKARWGKYLKGADVAWDKVVLSGHSQGSGHAAYLSKIHGVKGVFMLAGPQDRFEDGRAVPWLAVPSKTSTKQYYSLLHEKDFFGSAYQVAALKILLQSQNLTDHMEMLHEEVPDAHMSVISSRFGPQWKKFLLKAASL
jgi:hypothetical protein